jgi:type I restriction enzyme, S subunit
MITGLKHYPAMKDSSVAWLGAVPDHWQVEKLKYVVSFSGGGTPSKANASFWSGHIPWVSPKDMTHSRINNSADHITEEALAASATSVVAPGALLMVVRSGILRRTIPVGINTVDVALNQDMKALRPRPGIVQSEYLRLLVQGNEAALIREWTKQGATVESIEHEFLANSLVPLPPLLEQAAIVRFLDHADRRIRRYIRVKQQLIKLLEEQKQAIIHCAVTRGLDPNVHLKPSGVEWLGDVPEHWEVKRLRYLIKGRLTYGANAAAEHTNPEWPRYLRITDFAIDGSLRKDTFRSLPPETAKD